MWIKSIFLKSLATLFPGLTVFLWCLEFAAFLAPFEIGYNVEGLSSSYMTRRWRPGADMWTVIQALNVTLICLWCLSQQQFYKLMLISVHVFF